MLSGTKAQANSFALCLRTSARRAVDRHPLSDTRSASTGIPILGSAINFLKHHRESLKTDLYKDGPYIVRVGNGVVKVSHPGDEAGKFLTAAQWTDALVWAYTTADTIEQIVKQLAAYRAADTTGSMSYLLEMLPSRTLEALKAKLQREFPVSMHDRG